MKLTIEKLKLLLLISTLARILAENRKGEALFNAGGAALSPHPPCFPLKSPALTLQGTAPASRDPASLSCLFLFDAPRPWGHQPVGRDSFRASRDSRSVEPVSPTL